MNWHIITGEYPPQPGGVSDYTRAIACGLAEQGDPVTVWAPPAVDPTRPTDPGVTVSRLPDHFGLRSLRMLDACLDHDPGRKRILVQYVPHAYGWKALNVPFCLWLRSRRRDSVWVMFHEVAFPLNRHQALSENVVGLVTRQMASLVGGAAERTFISIPGWEPMVRALTPASVPVTWLPVPSAVPIVHDSAAVGRVRAAYAPDGLPLVGHFGTYGGPTFPLLRDALAMLLESSDCHVLLLGRGGLERTSEFLAEHPRFAERVRATGELTPDELSVHLSACDVMVQPYPDGISSRRTSAMAGLAHARPLVTTTGWLTEPFWRESCGAVLCPAGDAPVLAAATAALLRDSKRRARLGAEARAIYDSRFDIRHTIAALRAPVADRAALGAAS